MVGNTKSEYKYLVWIHNDLKKYLNSLLLWDLGGGLGEKGQLLNKMLFKEFFLPVEEGILNSTQSKTLFGTQISLLFSFSSWLTVSKTNLNLKWCFI